MKIDFFFLQRSEYYLSQFFFINNAQFVCQNIDGGISKIINTKDTVV